MRFRIEKIDYNTFAIPMCDKAFYACQLVKQKYLTCEQIKLLQLMGFEIEEKDLEKEDVINKFYSGDRHEQ